MTSCVWNILTKNYQNTIIGFQVTVKNVGMFFETQCSFGRGGGMEQLPSRRNSD